MKRWILQVSLTLCLVLSNLVGLTISFVLLRWVVPGADLSGADFFWISVLVVPIYSFLAFAIGISVGTSIAFHKLDWTFGNNVQPTQAQRTQALSVPAALTRLQVALWLGACVLLTVLCGRIDLAAIPQVGITILFAGSTVCSFSYYVSEFLLRSTAVKALTGDDFAGLAPQKILRRTGFIWAVGTALPVIGLMLIALFIYLRDAADRNADIVSDRSGMILAVATLSLGSVVLIFGLLLAILGQLAVRSSIRGVRKAMQAVEVGNSQTLPRVDVSEQNEIGDLQVGFNRMALKLEERGRLHDLFGKHVGAEVVTEALASGYGPAVQSRDVSVLFVDMIGSTALAAERTPTEVVGILNDFFGVVADAVSLHHGFINKFEGDAARVVFGGSEDSPSTHATNALQCAMEVRTRLTAEIPECSVSIGVATGSAIAANIGTADRYEYTILGQPVAAAMELSTIAKALPQRLLASTATIQIAAPEVAARWRAFQTRSGPVVVTAAVPWDDRAE